MLLQENPSMVSTLSKRQLQIGEEIKRHTSVWLNDMIDTKIDNDFLTIMRATVSKDLRYCKIYFRCQIANKDKFQQILDRCTNEIANLAYKQLKLRVRPEIRFCFDEVLELIDKVEKTLKDNHIDYKNEEE